MTTPRNASGDSPPSGPHTRPRAAHTLHTHTLLILSLPLSRARNTAQVIMLMFFTVIAPMCVAAFMKSEAFVGVLSFFVCRTDSGSADALGYGAPAYLVPPSSFPRPTLLAS